MTTLRLTPLLATVSRTWRKESVSDPERPERPWGQPGSTPQYGPPPPQRQQVPPSHPQWQTVPPLRPGGESSSRNALVLFGVILAVGGSIIGGWIVAGPSSSVSATVVDCSQTTFAQDPDSGVLQPRRIAQIRFVNNGDQVETFQPEVGGVGLISGSSRKPRLITLDPGGVQVINYPMMPDEGSSAGACYALNVSTVPK